MKYMICGDYFYKLLRHFTHKRVYRSGGKRRRMRMKWVRR